MIKYPFRQVGDADKRQKFEIEIVQLCCVYCDSVSGIWWDDDSEYKTWW